jgi:hypothetical protein
MAIPFTLINSFLKIVFKNISTKVKKWQCCLKRRPRKVYFLWPPPEAGLLI